MSKMTYREQNDYRRWYENWKRESWNAKFRQLREGKTRSVEPEVTIKHMKRD